jgi:predicted enzyme related to lactoylglutathione lyase
MNEESRDDPSRRHERIACAQAIDGKIRHFIEAAPARRAARQSDQRPQRVRRRAFVHDEKAGEADERMMALSAWNDAPKHFDETALAALVLASGNPDQAAKKNWERPMKIKTVRTYVDDQEKALKFYSEKLQLTKKADFSNGGYRWLTVVSADDPDGVELVLEANSNPAAKAFQRATFEQGQPAQIFYVDDVQAEHDRLVGLGVKFKMPATKVTGSTIAIFDDTCGNFIQIVALDKRA